MPLRRDRAIVKVPAACGRTAPDLKDTVLGDRDNLRAIARISVPLAQSKAISSRSERVSFLLVREIADGASACFCHLHLLKKCGVALTG